MPPNTPRTFDLTECLLAGKTLPRFVRNAGFTCPLQSPLRGLLSQGLAGNPFEDRQR
jgi:hypothetical protein